MYAQNTGNFNLPLSKTDKIWAGAYIILQDYANGLFPPQFEDQARAYQAEIEYLDSRPGTDRDAEIEMLMRKPFWGSEWFLKYSGQFGLLVAEFERLGIRPPARVLELGCGAGWMSEFLAASGYHVVGSSIAPTEIELARRRIASVEAKKMSGRLEYVVAPMESVHKVMAAHGPFDCVFVFEALHHAFDWRQTMRSAHACLRPGGWFVLANEPNVLHTFISYRVAKLSNTHEIGMSRKALTQELRAAGFGEIHARRPRINNWISAHWISAQRLSR